MFARSAADSKGPIAQFLSALDAAEAARVIPDVHLKVIVDTEEEWGSPHLPEAVERFRERLAADMLVIFDGPPHISGRPTLKFGARGIATVTLTTFGPRVPVHSGHYGNYAPNPALLMAEILASFKDETGRVVIPGWYEGVELGPETRGILDAVPDDEPAIRRELGIATTDDVGTTLQEAVQYPSLNVRGLRAGWVGDEVRTIIPDTAVAEIDVRLVAESDPERLLRLLRTHIERQGFTVFDRQPTEEERLEVPRKVRFESEISYAAFRTPFDSEPGRWLAAALTHLHGSEPIRIRTSGGSIPISPFVATLDVPAVSVPTVNPDNNQHSPNENLRVGSFVQGIRTMLAVLGQPLPPPRASSSARLEGSPTVDESVMYEERYKQDDPFAAVQDIPDDWFDNPSKCTANNYERSLNGGETFTFDLAPTYTDTAYGDVYVMCGGMTIKGNGTFQTMPGTYIIKDGPLLVEGKTVFDGSAGQTLYMTGADGYASFGGQADMKLRGLQLDGSPFEGFAMYGDPDNPATSSHILRGTNDNSLDGIIYLPGAHAHLTGTSGTSFATASDCALFVADTFTVDGTPDLGMKGVCSSLLDADAFVAGDVFLRLVN